MVYPSDDDAIRLRLLTLQARALCEKLRHLREEARAVQVAQEAARHAEAGRIVHLEESEPGKTD